MRATRVRLTDDDLKDIKPGTDFYKRAVDALGDIDAGRPYLKYAEEHLAKDGELEFDDDAAVSLGCDDGAYVMAWVWVSDDALVAHEYLERCDECEAVIPANEASLVNAHHLPSCSLFSVNEVNDAK